MKKILLFIPLISFSCFAQSTFDLGTKGGYLKWKGSNVVGGGHEGTLKLLSASLLVSDDRRLTGGTFVIDMSSIKTIDEHHGGVPELDDHLKSQDFFAVNKFPDAFFSIMQVDQGTNLEANRFTVTGLLTIKGITNQISFPAYITVGNGTTRVKATIVFNRTKWDIIYQSASFLADIKDTIISDNIEIEVDLNFIKHAN